MCLTMLFVSYSFFRMTSKWNTAQADRDIITLWPWSINGLQLDAPSDQQLHLFSKNLKITSSTSFRTSCPDDLYVWPFNLNTTRIYPLGDFLCPSVLALDAGVGQTENNCITAGLHEQIHRSAWISTVFFIQGGPKKTGPFLKVCNSCIWWRRKAFNIPKCSALYQK